MAKLHALLSIGILAAARSSSPLPTRHAFAAFPPDTLPVRPPAVPLIVADPFFSQWLPGDNLTDAYTVHWTIIFGGNGYKAMAVLVRVDGSPFRLLGPECPPGTPPLQQAGLRVYPSSTVANFLGAGVSLNLTFTSPIFGDGSARGENLPFVYLTLDAASVDGAVHEVEWYADVTAQLAVNTDSQAVAWSRVVVDAPAAVALRVGTASQAPFDGNGDNFRVDWGHLHLAGARGNVGAAASSNRMKRWFVDNGTLPGDDVVMPLPACAAAQNFVCKCGAGGAGAANDWPALGLTAPLGAVAPGGGARSAFAVIAYDDGALGAARFFGAPQSAYWRSQGRTVEELLRDALANYDANMARAVAGDAAAVAALRGAGLGEAYERLASLSWRQTLGANKLAWYAGDFGPNASPPAPHMWVKGCGSSGDTGTLDDNLPAVPFFLWAAPHLVPAFLAPLFMWAGNETWAGQGAPFPRNMTFDEAFAPHYLGQFPDAALQCWETPPNNHCEQMPIEMSASAITIVAAHALQTGDLSFALRYWPLLERWALYLSANGMFPALQRSSDDYEGPIANSTHLSAKAIIALGAYAQLCNATLRAAEGAAAWARAVEMRDTWVALAVDPVGPRHTMLSFGVANSSSVKYSWLFDVALGLNLFPAELVAAECAYLAAAPETAERYGWVLQRPPQPRNAWTNGGWLGFMLGVCPQNISTQLAAQMLDMVSTTQPRFPLTDWFDARSGAYVGFSARAQVGGVFAPVWVQSLRARRER
jgi:hypothetical protein